MNKWISVNEFTPKDTKYEKENVLVFYDGNCYVAYFNGDSWNEFGTSCGCCADVLKPSHWMPLPNIDSIVDNKK